jgi:cytochrome c-type biogenesis protein CcmF
MDIQYLGEWAFAGELGRISVNAAFTFALLASTAFLIHIFKEQKGPVDPIWRKIGVWAFQVHALAVLAIVAVLFVLIFNHRFEFDYVWKHSSLDLPLRYIFSCFWEGQEGSFLLWMIWHALLGVILLRTSGKWQAPVMLIFGLVQAFLASMILGIYVGDVMVGSSPFVLIRELPENIGAAWVAWPDYLERLPAFADGSGLNPLLQNYWMTIHPPTLFLGFASTLVPFAYALGALIKGDFKGWVAPALPWTFFSVMILGLGILMGGAWAYEALSFGGFWAWDPVENASLVPWLTLVGGAHLMLIQKNRGGTLHAAFLFIILTFLLILYSTFLTRSGVLGDSSVHSFVDLGLNVQLRTYLFFFIALAFGLYLFRYKKIPTRKKEESLDSREFWMFVGALVLLVSGFQIIFSTSMPVLNIFFGPEGYLPIFKDKLAAPDDPISHYNSFQMPFAIIIALLMGATQFLTYRGGRLSKYKTDIFLSLGLSIAASIIISLISPFEHVYFLLLFASIYVILANLIYWIRVAKGNVYVAGSAVAHVGFGMILLGSLVSNYKKEVISSNETYIHKNFEQNENLLIEEDDTVQMGRYYVTWVGEREVGNHRVYDMDYLLLDEKTGKYTKAFSLSPSILATANAGNNPEPATRHQLHKDLYTHLTYADLRTEDEKATGFKSDSEIEMAQGDTLIYERRFIVLDSLIVEGDLTSKHVDFLSLGAKIKVLEMSGAKYEALPKYIIQGNSSDIQPDEIPELGLEFSFLGINTEKGTMKLQIRERETEEPPFIIIKAIVFPWINILWAGSILLVIGTTMSIFQRVRANKKSPVGKS